MKQKIVIAALAFIMAWGSFSSSAFGEYITPKEAGFRNCALIYYNKNYNAESFKPLLVKYVDGKPTAQTGYDAFLFLVFNVNGKMTLIDPTDLNDWREQLEIFFHRGINVPALADACRELRQNGLLKERVKIIFSIPWPHPDMHKFGDLDGDGRSEDLANKKDLDKVLDWYIQTIASEMKKYPELDLWGFYMMNEGLAEKYWGMVRQFCGNIHKNGYKAFWIPYYNAPGAEQAYELGFDVSVMQSNWTFNTRNDGNGTRRNRLVNTAQWTKNHHQGIELEINPPEDPYWQEIFARTLETGTKTGFQQGASATYFGSDFYWPYSESKETRALYSLWMDYLAGKPIKLPVPGKWTQKKLADGKDQIIYRFNQPSSVQLVDLYYEDLPDEYFAALVSVEGKENETSDWKPLGWKIGRVTQNPTFPLRNMTVVFTKSTVKELKITVSPVRNNRIGRLAKVEPEMASVNIFMTKSFHKPYETSLPRAIPKYPDESGRDLLDGVSEGSWTNYVGWAFNRLAEVHLDLGDEIEYDEVRLHLLDQKSAAIYWPDEIEMVASRTAGVQADKGFGAVPGGFEYNCDFQGKPESNVSTLKLSAPQKARAVTLRFNRKGWLFLSEIELFLKGKRLPTDRFSYKLSPLDLDSDKVHVKYADDGIMLTDGYISGCFNIGNVGINNGKPLVVSVDLQKKVPIRKITCYLVDGHGAGVRMPKKGFARFSSDGKNWSKPLPFDIPVSKKMKTNRTIPVSVDCRWNARYIQVEFSSSAWTFLSEILVE